MASYGPPPPANFTVDGPSWRLQSLHHSPCIAPSNLTTGGFKNWTDVPRLPRDDPMIQDQLRPGRRYVTGPSSSEPFGLGAEPFGESGKKVVGVYLADVELLLQYVGLLPSTIMWRGMEPYTAPTGWSVGGGGVASTETSVVCIDRRR